MLQAYAEEELLKDEDLSGIIRGVFAVAKEKILLSQAIALNVGMATVRDERGQVRESP